MKILVTGGTGFVGRHFIRRMKAAGHSVRCLVRDKEKADALFGDAVDFVQGDIQNKDALQLASYGMDAIVHLVGIIYEPEGVLFQKVHVQGTANVILSARTAGVRRLIHFSASGAEKKSPSRYFRTKWEAEELVRQSGLDYTIFRPTLIFGPGDNLINRYMKWITWLPILPVVGSGKHKVQPIFINDVARAIQESLNRPISIGQTYALGGPSVLNSRQIISELAAVLRKERMQLPIPASLLWVIATLMEKLLPNPLLTIEQLQALHRDNICDITALEHELEIHPMSLQKSVRDFRDVVIS